MFCARDKGLGGVGRHMGTDGTGTGVVGVSVRTCLEEVLLDQILEAWVADMFPEATECLGVFCS